MNAVALDPLFVPYIEELEIMRRRDPKTVDRNRYALARLSLHLAETGTKAAEVENGLLSRYFVGLLSSLAESTVSTEVAYVKAAYRFAVEEGRMEKLPTIRFERQNGYSEPKTFSNDELRKIREEIGDPLDWTLFHLLAYTGCRRAELVNLTWADVDFEARELRVVGKGNKPRRVPIHPLLLKVLRERQRKYPNSATVLGAGGSMRNVNARPGALLKRAGVDGGNRPAHAFRKTVASVLAEEGVSIDDIEKILGWTSQSIRGRIYTRTNPNLYDAILKLYASDPIERASGRLAA